MVWHAPSLLLLAAGLLFTVNRRGSQLAAQLKSIWPCGGRVRGVAISIANVCAVPLFLLQNEVVPLHRPTPRHKSNSIVCERLFPIRRCRRRRLPSNVLHVYGCAY